VQLELSWLGQNRYIVAGRITQLRILLPNISEFRILIKMSVAYRGG